MNKVGIDPFLVAVPQACPSASASSLPKAIAQVNDVPFETDNEIRRMCDRLLTAKSDAETQVIVDKLRAMLEEHISRAKSSLGIRASVIRKMDPEAS